MTYYFLGDDNMYVTIPFEKEIEFSSNISEITKISLEHDYNLNDGVVLGNFYVFGEYKTHPVSVNTEEFKYTLPFSVELDEKIKEDTLEFNIEDFNYTVMDNRLNVNIEYSLKAEKNEDLFRPVNEDELEGELSYIDEFLESEERDEKVTETSRKNEEENRENEREGEIKIDTMNVIDSVNNGDEYVTYHIHMVKENETIESISKEYKISLETMNEYNNIDSLNVGDKLIIPEIDE